MRVLIYGATGMIGQGVLRECLLDPDVAVVQTIGRSGSGKSNPKLREVVRSDLFHYADIENQLQGFDACFFCLGVSSSRVSETEYERLTFALTIAAAETLVRLNPAMTFIYVSGMGADSSEQGRIAWARVRGKTENAILRMPFRAAYVFRPAAVQPTHGEVSRTPAYRILYSVLKPFVPLLRGIFPRYFLTTEEFGRAMLQVTRKGASKKVLESSDIKASAY
jgi:uncharacterized protein YbjT (DUF2867 family)